jgi:glycosyltransferase involved in cell wall biosynthesis
MWDDNAMKASVIIPCRNEVNHIGFVIDSILKNTFKNVEIIIVDGLSNDGTKEKLNELKANHSNIKIIDNHLQITPVAFNLGIKNATGDFIFIVGARHILQENYIGTCIKILTDNPEIACVGGKVNNTYENETSELISQAMSSSFAVGAGNFRIMNKDSYVDTVGTPAYRKSIFDEIGYFDEELLRNQDDEYNYRVTKQGYKILFTIKTSIQYFVRASFKNLFKQYAQYGYWKVYVNKKHKTVTTIRQVVPLFFVLFLIAGLILSLFHSLFFIAYLSGLIFYSVVSCYAAFKQSKKINQLLKIMFTFFILHLSYGWGYLKGIVDFFILQKSIRKQELLTR